jgi:exodeoxyribonuclease VII large subunit
MVAFRNAITPTKLAEFLIQTFREFDQEILFGQQIIRNKSLDILFNANMQLESLLRLFKQVSKHSISLSRQQLVEFNNSMKFLIQKSLTKNQTYLLNLQINVKHSAQMLLTSPNYQLNLIKEQVINQSTNFMNKQSNSLMELEKNINLLDPIHVLNRGFSITRINGKAITNSDELNDGDELQTQTAKGEIRSVVRKG